VLYEHTLAHRQKLVKRLSNELAGASLAGAGKCRAKIKMTYCVAGWWYVGENFDAKWG
jgi:hypothetical protein